MGVVEEQKTTHQEMRSWTVDIGLRIRSKCKRQQRFQILINEYLIYKEFVTFCSCARGGAFLYNPYVAAMEKLLMRLSQFLSQFVKVDHKY